MIESFTKKCPIPSQKQCFWKTQTSPTSQRFVIINGNSITDAIVVFFIFFLFTLAILYEATGDSLNLNLIAITAKLQLVCLWFVQRMLCGFFYHLLIVVKVKAWSRVGQKWRHLFGVKFLHFWKNPSKRREFLRFYCYFYHVCRVLIHILICNTKIGEKSDMAKSWATFCSSGT